MTSNILKPKTWLEVYEALFLDTYNPRIDRYKSRFAYRGVSSESYNMSTSLMRLKGDYAKVEFHLLRQFKKYAYFEIEEKKNDWFWLSLGQHHGLPTRLLDWSYSPNVALHFATSNTNNYDKDGAIWKVNYKKVHEELPPILKGYMEEHKSWILTTEILSKLVPDLKTLDDKGGKNDFILFYEPPAIDQRIYNQFAYFSITSRPDLLIDDWLASRPEYWQKVIIPKELKWEIRDKLDQNNISERILFPGLDGLSQWLSRYYLPTGKAKK